VKLRSKLYPNKEWYESFHKNERLISWRELEKNEIKEVIEDVAWKDKCRRRYIVLAIKEGNFWERESES